MCPCWSNPWGSRRVGAGIVVISRTVTGYSFKEPLFQEVAQKSLDCDRQNSYPRIAQSRTCLWVSADPRYGEDLVRYLELTPSSRFSGQPVERGHLEATTVRAFLVSAGFPTAGVTEEAHLHCRTCGRDSLPIQGRHERMIARQGRLSFDASGVRTLSGSSKGRIRDGRLMPLSGSGPLGLEWSTR